MSGPRAGTVRGVLLGVAVLLLGPRAARADDSAKTPPPPASGAAPDDTPPAHAAIEVRVLGDRADQVQRVAGSATVIGAKELRRAAPFDAAEVLRRVPGLVVRQDPGAGLRFDIGVRGLDPGRSRRVLVLEDGMPISLNPYAEPDLYHAPSVDRLRSIEVVKGSGSILFGPQTVGGVVNLRTLTPPDTRLLAAQLDAGEHGYFRARALAGDAHAETRWLVQAVHTEGDGARQTPYRSEDVLAKLAFSTSPRGELTLKLGFRDDRTIADDVGMTRWMAAIAPERGTLAPDDVLQLRRAELGLTHEQRLSEAVTLTTLGYAYVTTRLWRRQDYHRHPLPGVRYERIVGNVNEPGGAIYFLPSDTILDRAYSVAGVEPRLTARGVSASVGHTLDVGARLLHETADYEQRAGGSPTSEAGALETAEDHRTLALAAYVQDRMAFTDELYVTPGLRVEHAAFERHLGRRIEATGPADVDVSGESEHTAWIPGLGMTYGWPEAHAFAGLHVGYAPPRLTTAVSANGVDEALDAERAIHYELGGRLGRRKARLELTAFLSSFSNQIVSSTVPGAPTELVNGGTTRHLGLEGSGTAALGTLLALPLTVDVTARGTFSRARFVGGERDGRTLPYAPKLLASLVLDVEHELGLGGQVAYSHVGAQFADETNTEAVDATGRTGLIPAYDTLDLGLRYQHRASGLTALATVKNALDSPYVAARRPEGIFFGGVRQATLGLRWESRAE